MLTYQIILDIFGILSDKSSASSFFSQYYLQLHAQFENFMRRLCPDTQRIYNIILAFFIQTSSLTVHSEWNGGDISGGGSNGYPADILQRDLQNSAPAVYISLLNRVLYREEDIKVCHILREK